MVGAKIALGMSVSGMITGGVAQSLLDDGEKLGHMGALGIMGVCLLACVAAIAVLYKQMLKQHDATTEKLTTIIEKDMEVSIKALAKIEDSMELEKDVRDVMIKCKGKVD